MRRDPGTLADETFDLLIIGGGAFGAAAAWDASLRGLRVAVIERDDFGGGASAECFKMVHGGIRYLQHADIGRLRSSCHERSALLRIAPHLVSPLPIVIPTYGHGRKGKAFLGAGMCVYDLLTLDRNHGIADKTRRIPWTRFLGRAELLGIHPELDGPSLTGAAIFDDGQMYSPPRLVLAYIQSAVGRGAVACNYVEATGFLWDGDRVLGVSALDRLTQERFEIRARLVLNAAGPGAEYLLEREGRFGRWQRGNFSRDACFIIKRPPRSKYALAIQGQTRDRDARFGREARHMFLVPWRGHTLVGVWHKLFPGHPDTTVVDGQELETWIDEINASCPSLELKRGDVMYANCGLVPFGQGTGAADELSFGHESRYIDHLKAHGVKGLVTLVGIRFTTSRGDAARALDLLLGQLDKAPPRADTTREPLRGGRIERFAEFESMAHRTRPGHVSPECFQALLRNHGTEYRTVLDTDVPAAAQTLVGTHTLVGEVAHAVRHEMAVQLADVALRRTDLGSGSHPGPAALTQAAEEMQRWLGWTDQERDRQVSIVSTILRRHHAAPASP